MEDQKTRAPRKFMFFQIRSNAGFKNEDSHLQEHPEKKTTKFPIKLNNPVPSSSKDSTESYSSSKSGFKGNISLTFDAHWNTPTCWISDSHKFHLLQWAKTAKGGRKSLSSSTLSYSSLFTNEKQVEPLSDEKEAADTLWLLANCYSEDHRVSSKNFPEKDRIAEFPFLKRKRKTDIECTNDHLKNARIEKETKNCRDEIILDTVKKTNLEATHKQIPILSTGSGKFSCDCGKFSCDCGKSFSSYQALGGHKSSCKRLLLKRTLQDSLRDTIKELTSSNIHRCKLCSKTFSTGRALGGHQRMHRTRQDKPRISRPSVSPSKEIRKEPSSQIYYLTSTVQEAQDEVTNKKRKIMMFDFDLNENPPEDMDESTDLRL